MSGPEFGALLAQMHDADSNQRRAAAAALGELRQVLTSSQVEAIVQKLAEGRHE